jgi:hypothetical protein
MPGHATVIDWTLTKHTGRHHTGWVSTSIRDIARGDRPSGPLVGRPEDRDRRHACRSGQVHRPGIVGDAALARLITAASTGSVVSRKIDNRQLAISWRSGPDCANGRRIAAAADKDARHAAVAHELCRHAHHMTGNPLLGFAIGSPWRQHHERGLPIPTAFDQQRAGVVKCIRRNRQRDLPRPVLDAEFRIKCW